VKNAGLLSATSILACVVHAGNIYAQSASPLRVSLTRARSVIAARNSKSFEIAQSQVDNCLVSVAVPARSRVLTDSTFGPKTSRRLGKIIPISKNRSPDSPPPRGARASQMGTGQRPDCSTSCGGSALGNRLSCRRDMVQRRFVPFQPSYSIFMPADVIHQI